MRLIASRCRLPALFIAVSLSSCATLEVSDEPSLYTRLGGNEVIIAVVADFTEKIRIHPGIGARFAGADVARFKTRLAEQICAAAAGPCLYSGPAMESVHRGMHISEAEFDVFMQELTLALDRANLPAREKSEVIGILLPLKYEVIEG